MKKIIRIITDAVFVLLIIVAVLLVFSMLPIKNNYKILAVTSESMSPTIPMGSLVVVKPSEQYKVNDIVTFNPPDATRENEYVTHRIVDISEVGGSYLYTTKGDANNVPDAQKIWASRIEGKVLFSIALLGYLLFYAKTLPGLVIIIVLATIIVYEELKKIKSEVGKIKQSKETKTKKTNKKQIVKNKTKKKR